MSSFICPICRDLLHEPREIEPGSRRLEYHPVVTFCGHVFHLHCLKTWFASLEDRGSPLSCPTCFQAILASDVVKMYPASDENFEDYQSVQRRAQKLTRENGVLTFELSVATDNLHASAETIAKSEEKVDELTEQVKNLQLLVKAKKDDDLNLKPQMKSVYPKTEVEEQPFQCDPKKFFANARKASNFKNILKYVQLLVNEKESSNAENSRISTRDRISESNARGRDTKQEPNYEDIVKNIQAVFTSRDVFED